MLDMIWRRLFNDDDDDDDGDLLLGQHSSEGTIMLEIEVPPTIPLRPTNITWIPPPPARFFIPFLFFPSPKVPSRVWNIIKPEQVYKGTAVLGEVIYFFSGPSRSTKGGVSLTERRCTSPLTRRESRVCKALTFSKKKTRPPLLPQPISSFSIRKIAVSHDLPSFSEKWKTCIPRSGACGLVSISVKLGREREGYEKKHRRPSQRAVV